MGCKRSRVQFPAPRPIIIGSNSFFKELACYVAEFGLRGIRIMASMKYQLENGFFAYDQNGKGVPLLFIHGYPLSRKIWKPQIDGLANIASMIRVDLRGHGESYPFEGAYRMDLLAEDCYQLLQSIKVDPPIVVCGLSMGGYVTFALYRQYPKLFKGMILTSTRAAADSAEGKASREDSIKNVRENGIVSIVDGMTQKLVSPFTLTTKKELVASIREIMLETSINGFVGALQGMRDRPDTTPLLSQIECPVLIVHGADDQIIPFSEAEKMCEQVSNGRLVAISQAGHLPNMEQPERYNQVVRDFISSLT
jgi:3-oxoadipate enol-lactonase